MSDPVSDVDTYIHKHASLAIAEMQRSGIPASIILAQGILETDSGNSQLATNANNHFGIKCKEYWNGASYYKVDDDRNSRGALIQSCFRSYPSTEASYRDHSEFLLHSSHYRTLFEFKQTEYQKWAKGLLSCGYATDPGYDRKLIRIIQQNHLFRFDEMNQKDLDMIRGESVADKSGAWYQLPVGYQRRISSEPN